MTSGEFDFFGAPTTPPPSAPPVGAPVNQFGLPTVTNQFGTPVAPGATNQFGLPVTAPAPVLLPPVKDQTGRNLAVIGGLVAAVLLLTGGLVYLQHMGKKSADKVATAVETPIVKAHQIVETSDLQQAEQAQEAYLAENSTYATSIAQLPGFHASATDSVTVVSATATTFCLRADDVSPTLPAPSMYLSSAGSAASTTPCT